MPKLVISFTWKGKKETADVLKNNSGPMQIYNVYFTNPFLTEKYGSLVIEKSNGMYSDITDKDKIVPIDLIDLVCMSIRAQEEPHTVGQIS